MFTYLLSLFFGVFISDSNRISPLQAKNTVTIFGSCYEPATGRDLKIRAFALVKEKKIALGESKVVATINKFNIQLPDSAEFLAFESEGYRPTIMPIRRIGKIEENFKFEIIVPMASVNSPPLPSENQLHWHFSTPDKMEVNFQVNNILDINRLIQHNHLYLHPMQPGKHSITARSPDGRLLLNHEFNLEPGLTLMDVRVNDTKAIDSPLKIIPPQVENSIRINGSCRDNTTKDYLKQSVVYAVFKSSRKLISKSDETGNFDFQIPDSTKYLSFEVEKYHTATIPVNFIGKIAGNSKFPVFVEMSLKDSLLMPLRNQLTICLTVPDSMDIEHEITHFNSTAFSKLSFHKNFNNGKHWPFYYFEGFRPGSYWYTASSPDGSLFTKKEMTLSPGFNFADVHIEKPEKTADVITTLPSQAKTVYFVQSSYELTNETKAVLDSVSLVLSKQPNKMAHVTGYTDNVGEQEKNLTLSEYRARTVENYLKQRGVKPDQLNVKWKGSNAPAASNTSEQTKIKNRRVEIQILSK